MCPKRFFNFSHRPELNRPLDMTMNQTKNCSWCDISISDSASINIPDSDQINKGFCSEKCFESSRRASFKRTKICDWCDKLSVSDNGVKSGSEYSSTSRASLKSDSVEILDTTPSTVIDHLQFCNDSCLQSYKQTYFVKETAEVLQVKKEKTVVVVPAQAEILHVKTVEALSSPILTKNNVVPNKVSKQLYKSPKIIRPTSIPKFQKSSKRLNSTPPSLLQKMNNLCHPIFNPFSAYSEFISSYPTPHIPSFSIPTASENVKIPSSNPIYIPIPIPIPIPIFKNAPEILDILHQYGYKQSKHGNDENKNSKSATSIPKRPAKILSPIAMEPQTEALDLSGPCTSKPDLLPSKTSMNMSSSFPIASILQLNDPYLKRRNRILDAPPSSIPGNINHQMTGTKNFNLNYTELVTSTQLKAGKYSKRKIERNTTLPKSTSVHQAQPQRQIVQTAKSLLRRYPLISLHRNIKSAPSSVLDSNNPVKNISD